MSIDPAFASDAAGLTVVDSLFDSLTRLTPDGDVVGAAAEDWEVSADARTFTFALRDARFYDGTPVRAEDFVRGLDRVAGGSTEHQPAHPQLLTDIEGFEATYLTRAPLADPDPDDLLYRAFSSRKLGVTNLTRYASTEVDALLERARATTDRAARLDLYRRVEQHVLEDAVVVPVWYDRMGHATRRAVEGLEFDAWGRPHLTRVTVTP